MNLNLLPSQAKFQAAKIQFRKRIVNIIIGVVGVWVVMVAFVLSLNLYTKSRVEATNSEYKKIFQNYKGMADSIVSNQNLKFKSKMVGGVLKERFEYGEAFELIQNLFPTGINISDYNLTQNGAFLLNGTASGKENVDFLENMVLEINRGDNVKLKSAKIETLSVTNNNWNFKMEVALK